MVDRQMNPPQVLPDWVDRQMNPPQVTHGPVLYNFSWLYLTVYYLTQGP
jgi:hypothetical protein